MGNRLSVIDRLRTVTRVRVNVLFAYYVYRPNTTGELSNGTTNTSAHHDTVVHLLCSHISSPAPSPIVPCRFMDMIGGDARGAAGGNVFARRVSALPGTDLLRYLCRCRWPATWSIPGSYTEGFSLIE